jgi:type IV secretory pathway TraG/TraD family ATPase VirD4
VYATVEHVLAVFGDPAVVGADRPPLDVEGFFEARASSIFLVAPARAQERLAPLFVALLGELLEGAFARASASGPRRHPLLLVLDEAANIAPVRDLDVVASTAAGHRIQLVTVFQDVAQIVARYGEKAPTIVNNHRARLLCSGVADPRTLEEVSRLLGETEIETMSRSTGDGGTTTTRSHERRSLATPDALRRIEPGEGVLLYGHLPPAVLRLRPWFEDRRLRALSSDTVR